MITITYATKTARCEIELPNEDAGPLGWLPDGSTIRVEPPEYERTYQAVPSPLYKPKGKTE